MRVNYDVGNGCSIILEKKYMLIEAQLVVISEQLIIDHDYAKKHQKLFEKRLEQIMVEWNNYRLAADEFYFKFTPQVEEYVDKIKWFKQVHDEIQEIVFDLSLSKKKTWK